MLNQDSTFDELLESVPKESVAHDLLSKLKAERLASIENFSHSCRLAADIHHDASVTRRNLLLGNMSNFSSVVKDAIKETDIGEFLFGANLLETIKAAKVSENATKKQERSVPSSRQSKNFKRPLGNKGRSPPPSGRHSMSAPKNYKDNNRHRSHSSRKGKGNYQNSRKN